VGLVGRVAYDLEQVFRQRESVQISLSWGLAQLRRSQTVH
jgi:hypothetical protein